MAFEVSSTTTISSPVPVIEISFAPPEEPVPEPYSPFTPLNQGFRDNGDEDGYRSTLLTPPAQSFSLSRLRPLPSLSSCSLGSGAGVARKPKGQGLKDEDFQALLRASKERSKVFSSQKKDLRKEVALKVHKNKQAERRALFLSKIGAPPSPTAISLPKTPPESPAIFHYSLPSPGLVSPLAHFETLEEEDDEFAPRKVWVEQVDFKLLPPPGGKAAAAAKQKRLGVYQGGFLNHERNVLALDVQNEREERRRSGTRPGLLPLPTITVTTGESDQDHITSRIEKVNREQQRVWQRQEQQQQVQQQQQKGGHTRKTSWPSLEQITERYSGSVSVAGSATSGNGNSSVNGTVTTATVSTPRVRAPLPAFITARMSAAPSAQNTSASVEIKNEEPVRSRPRLTCTGRIRFPSREPTATTATTITMASDSPLKPLPSSANPIATATVSRSAPRQRTNALPSTSSPPVLSPSVPSSPALPSPALSVGSAPPSPKLQITVTQVPNMQASTKRSVQLTEANLEVFNSRTRTAKDMLFAVRRRTAIAGGCLLPVPPRSESNNNLNKLTNAFEMSGLASGVSNNRNLRVKTSGYGYGSALNLNVGAGMLSPRAPWADEDEKHRRRNSAPAELPKVDRIGFMHPVLALPGGF